MKSLADFLGTGPAASPEQESAPAFSLRVKDFCRGILESAEYRQSLLVRITLGELPPQIETMLWDRACGKVVSHVSVDVQPDANPSKDQLLVRIAYLQSLVDDLEETSEPVNSDDQPTTRVH